MPSPPVTKTPLSWMVVTPENVINGIKRIVSNGPFCRQTGSTTFTLNNFFGGVVYMRAKQVCMLINSARSCISESVNDNGWDFYFGNLK